MLNFNDRPIRSKLMALIMFSVLASIILLGAVFVTYEFFSQRHNMEQEYSTTAKIIADRSQAAMLFQDIPGLEENLSSLRVKKDILAGCLYDTSGLLAYFKVRESVDNCPESPTLGLRAFEAEQYLHSEPIEVDDEVVGVLLIRVSLEQLYRQLVFYVAMVLLFILLISGLAFLLSRYLQEYIARPLLSLTGTANEVATTQNYDLTATRESSDEIGELVDAFNSMLVTIKAQNARIVQNSAELDLKVKERTQALAKSNRELGVANKELEAFSYSVSHDLRSPLRAIDGFTRALEEDYADQLDDLASSYIQRARSAAQKMGELISTLLQLSRVTRKELEIEDVDFSALAQTACQNLRNEYPQREVELDILAGVRAQADVFLLEVAVDNLLSNAWKYSSNEEKARIEIGCREERGVRVYYIRDNGAGFDKTYAGDLFTAFKRLHSDEEFEGTGIGLATVARVVHRHHGDIWATSEVGEGACFYFTLNQRRPDNHLSDAQSNSREFNSG